MSSGKPATRAWTVSWPSSSCLPKKDDGRLSGFYFVSSKGLEYLNLSTGASKTILTIEKPMSLGLALSPDGRSLLYTLIAQGGSDLMLVENFR